MCETPCAHREGHRSSDYPAPIAFGALLHTWLDFEPSLWPLSFPLNNRSMKAARPIKTTEIMRLHELHPKEEGPKHLALHELRSRAGTSTK